jgi:hypothetical protein
MADDCRTFARKIEEMPIPAFKRRLAKEELIAAWAVADAILAIIDWVNTLRHEEAPREETERHAS